MMSRPAPVPLATLKAVLGQHGAAPRKRHGQHFLQDDNLLAAIVRDAEPEAGDTVVEIGPGPGLLTRHLLATGASVVAIEIDSAMHAVARDLIEPELQERLEWQDGDAMAGQRRLAPVTKAALARSRLMVSNLPYNIAGALLGAVVGAEAGPERVVVMIQREMADRLLAQPGGRTWGPLAILMSLFSTRVERLRSIPPDAFWPAPRVSSAVVAIHRVAAADRPQGLSIEALEAFLAAAFHQRRKTLVNSVAGASGERAADVAEVLGLPENRHNWRAEAFDGLQFYDLAFRWANRARGERIRPDPS